MGFTIGDIKLQDFGLGLVEYHLSPTPEIINRRKKIHGRDGSLPMGTNYGENTITVRLSASDNNVSQLLNRVRKFTSAISPKQGAQPFILDDDPTVLRYVQLDAGNGYRPIKGLFNAITSFELTFIMTDPFTYSVNETVIDRVLAYGETITVVNNGGLEAPAEFYIYPPDTSEFSPANGIGGVNSGDSGTTSTNGVKITVNDKYIKYNGIIYTGDEVVINTKDYTVSYDKDNALRYWEGDFPQFAVGDNSLTVTDEAGIGIHLIIKFRERWL